MEFTICPSEKCAAVPPSVMLYYNPFSYAYHMSDALLSGTNTGIDC
jgi:hypothetical protein